MKETFRTARDKLERVQAEAFRVATEQLVPRDAVGPYEDFKEEKKGKKK